MLSFESESFPLQVDAPATLFLKNFVRFLRNDHEIASLFIAGNFFAGKAGDIFHCYENQD